jgi:hypothetical protein
VAFVEQDKPQQQQKIHLEAPRDVVRVDVRELACLSPQGHLTYYNNNNTHERIVKLHCT